MENIRYVSGSGRCTVVHVDYMVVYILVIRAIEISRTACKDEFRRNLRSHIWSV